MVRLHVLVAVLATLSLLLPVAADPAPLDVLLAKVLDAYGGAAALERVVAVEERGKVHALMRHAGQVGELRRVFQPPDRLRVEVAYPDGDREVRVVDGDHGWRDGEAVQGPMLAAMQVQAARLALPWLLHQRRAALEDEGEVERDGVALRQVAVPLAGGTALTVEIDPAAGHIVRSTGTISMASMGSMEFRTTYDDFRRVGEMVFAFHEGNYAAGRHTADTVLESVKLRGSVAPGTFAPGNAPLQTTRWRFHPGTEVVAWPYPEFLSLATVSNPWRQRTLR
jgi:hypothetical protein